MEMPKRKSPRFPTLALEEAMSRAEKMYKAEGRHPTAVEVMLKHLGYNSKNGASVQVIASLRYWGLIDRPKDGFLAVTKEFEQFHFAPEEKFRQKLLIGFFTAPPLFAELLTRYGDRLPSDASLKFDLIQRGFLPSAADVCLNVFKKSMEYCGYNNLDGNVDLGSDEGEDESGQSEGDEEDGLNETDLRAEVECAPSNSEAHTKRGGLASRPSMDATAPKGSAATGTPLNLGDVGEMDQIPVRLGGGRRAWLVIPSPFYEADKSRLKAQIELLLADDEAGL